MDPRHSTPASLTRYTKWIGKKFSRRSKLSEASVDDELRALEEALHSFALVPALLTPSRLPSNTLVASSHALFFERPVLLDFTSGWANGPVFKWYDDLRRNKGSTLIKKLQLRRDLRPPYYHEYIVVFTRGGHAFRLDRRPDVDTPFDTITRMGCKAYDTVQSVGSRSLNLLEETSNCVVELHWPDEQAPDLLFVLSVCFALAQDKEAKQYTLQRYNCIFLSWTIIIVTVRETAAWETRLDTAMSEAFTFNERKKKSWVRALAQPAALAVAQTMAQAVAQEGDRGLSWKQAGRGHLDRVRLEVEQSVVQELKLELDIRLIAGESLELLEWALKREQRLEQSAQHILELVRLEKVMEPLLAPEDGEDGDPGRAIKWVQAEEALKEALGDDLGWDFDIPADNESGRLNVMPLLDEMQESMQQCAKLMSKLLFPRELDDWQSTMLQNRRSLPAPMRYVQSKLNRPRP